jgi:uncharacterized protein (DUF4415 family)
MKKGFFSRFGRPVEVAAPASEPSSVRVDQLAPGVVPRAEAAAAAAVEVADIVRGIARQGLPQSTRKAAISLRVDPKVLEWFKAQGPGYQTRINAVLRAYMEASDENPVKSIAQ